MTKLYYTCPIQAAYMANDKPFFWPLTESV